VSRICFYAIANTAHTGSNRIFYRRCKKSGQGALTLFWMNYITFDLNSSRLTKSRCVYFDEAGTVDEDLGPQVAGGDELLPVLQPGDGHAAQRLEEAGPLARSQPAHKLHQVLGVGVRHALVNVHAHVVHQIDEVEIQSLWARGVCQKVGLGGDDCF
jgi:hypothetical protein